MIGTDVAAIKRRRAQRDDVMVDGARIGNLVSEGDEVAALIVKVWLHGCVNLKLQLDGNDELWVTSVLPGAQGEPAKPGEWHWPHFEPTK